MAVSEAAGGSQAATLDTEHTLTTQTTAGVYSLLVDLSVLAAGDAVTIRIYDKVRTAESAKIVHLVELAHAQNEPVFLSPPFPIADHIACSIEQTDGTARTFIWSLRKI